MNRYPLRVAAHRDESLSRWLWLVKWLLLIPHYVILLFLYAGMVVLTLVAYLAVLFLTLSLGLVFGDAVID